MNMSWISGAFLVLLAHHTIIWYAIVKVSLINTDVITMTS